MNDNIALLEVGVLNHSRWLSLSSRVFRKYTLAHNPLSKLTKLTEYCIKVYFPSWFEIKTKISILDGALNFYNIVQRVMNFSNLEIGSTAMNNLQKDLRILLIEKTFM